MVAFAAQESWLGFKPGSCMGFEIVGERPESTPASKLA
jgi:hypothetical protein